MSDPIDISRLRDLARSATPGPWAAQIQFLYPWGDMLSLHGPVGAKGTLLATLPSPATDADRQDGANARYLAALDPTTVLSLLDKLDDYARVHLREARWHQETKAECESLRARIASLEAERDRLREATGLMRAWLSASDRCAPYSECAARLGDVRAALEALS